MPDLQQAVVDIHVDQSVMDYISALVESSRSHQNVRIGVSPRGTLALYKTSQALAAIRGRDYVIPEDVKELVRPVFAKRIILTSQAVIRGVTVDAVITSLLDSVPTPVVPEQRA